MMMRLVLVLVLMMMMMWMVVMSIMMVNYISDSLLDCCLKSGCERMCKEEEFSELILEDEIGLCKEEEIFRLNRGLSKA